MKSKRVQRAQAMQMFKFAVAALVGCAIVYVIIIGPKMLGKQDVTADSKTTVSENRVDNSKPDREISDFEKAIRSRHPEKLKEYYKVLKDWPPSPIVIRLENINKRIEIADLILEISKQSEDRQFAIEAKLQSMMDREEIAIKHKAFAPKATKELSAYALDNRTELRELSSLAVSMANVSRFIREKHVATRSGLRQVAVKSFKETIQPDNTLIGKKLSDQVSLVLEYGIETEATPFLEAYVSGYSKNSDVDIVTAVKKFSLIAKSDSSELPDVIGSPPELRDIAVQRLSVQVDDLFAKQNENFDAERASLLLDRTRDLIRIGRIQTAREIYQKMDFAAAKYPVVAGKWRQLESGLELAESIFDSTGLQNREGEVNLNHYRGQSKILLFVSQKTYKSSGEKYAKLRKDFGKKLEEYLFRIVFVDNGKDREAFRAILEFTTRAGIELLALNPESVKGQIFSRKIPVDNTPFVIVLDKNNRFLAIDPPIDLIYELLSKRSSVSAFN